MQHFPPPTGIAIGPMLCHAPSVGDRQGDLVLTMIGKAYKVRRRLLLHPSRSNAAAVIARHTAMYLMHVVLGRPMSAVGTLFNRDRTTVSYACAKVEELRDDPRFDARLDQFERCILDLIASGEDGHVAR
jgi:hypothetical protein